MIRKNILFAVVIVFLGCMSLLQGTRRDPLLNAVTQEIASDTGGYVYWQLYETEEFAEDAILIFKNIINGNNHPNNSLVEQILKWKEWKDADTPLKLFHISSLSLKNLRSNIKRSCNHDILLPNIVCMPLVGMRLDKSERVRKQNEFVTYENKLAFYTIFLTLSLGCVLYNARDFYVAPDITLSTQRTAELFTAGALLVLSSVLLFDHRSNPKTREIIFEHDNTFNWMLLNKNYVLDSQATRIILGSVSQPMDTRPFVTTVKSTESVIQKYGSRP